MKSKVCYVLLLVWLAFEFAGAARLCGIRRFSHCKKAVRGQGIHLRGKPRGYHCQGKATGRENPRAQFP